MRKNPKLKNIKNPQKSAILNPDQLFFSSGAERMSPPTDSIQDPSKDSLSDSSGRKEGRKGGRTRNPFSFKKLFSCFSPSSEPSASGEGAEEVEVSVEVEGGITRNTSFFTAIQTSPILPSPSGSGSGDEEDYANHPPPPRTRFVPAYYPPVFLPSFPPTMLWVIYCCVFYPNSQFSETERINTVNVQQINLYISLKYIDLSGRKGKVAHRL